jgi:hypothetical protein
MLKTHEFVTYSTSTALYYIYFTAVNIPFFKWQV